MNARILFQKVLAQTSTAPLALHIEKAKDAYLFDTKGKAYIDLIGGISVCNIGHCNPEVVAAIQKQAEQYMHIMVYGELIQTPQLEYASLLTSLLDDALNSVYFTSSGSEAVEGAMKLAKRVTQRTEIIAFKNSYHGSTQGALSILGDEYWRNAYRPLLPNIQHLDYASYDALSCITEATAAVFAEPIQAEAGIIVPEKKWLQALANRCKEVGALLVFDEIQTGFGRSGTLFAHQGFNVVPDILLLGKALGGGMPMGAFIAHKSKMDLFTDQPVLGHITTFGGHPVSCAAGKAGLEVLLKSDWIEASNRKAELFIDHLDKQFIDHITYKGLMMALHLSSSAQVLKVIHHCLESENAVFTDWFLFAPHCIRIVPPLCISNEEIITAANTLNQALKKAQ